MACKLFRNVIPLFTNTVCVIYEHLRTIIFALILTLYQYQYRDKVEETLLDRSKIQTNGLVTERLRARGAGDCATKFRVIEECHFFA